MKVVIVSKTKMSANDCIGGIIIKTKQFVRLLDKNGSNQPENCDFEIGEVWNIEFVSKTSSTPPHIEDVLVSSKAYTQKKANKEELSKWIQDNDSFKDKI